MNRALAERRRPHRRDLLLPARARRRLRLPQAAARAVRRPIGERFGVDAARRADVVGDSLRDLQAGAAAGCAPHLVLTGKGARARRRRSCARCVKAVPQAVGPCRPRRLRAAADPARAHRARRCRRGRLGVREAALMAALSLAAALGAVRPVPGGHRRAVGADRGLVYSIFVRGERLYWSVAGWLRLSIWGARVICGVRARVHGLREPARHAGHPAAQAPVDLGDLRLPDADAAAALLRVQARAALHPVLRLGDGAHGHDPHRPQQARRGLEPRSPSRAGASWRRATGSSCFPKARARRAAARARTRSAARGWRSRPAGRCVPIAVTSARCWPRKSFLLRPGVIDVSIGKPIASAGRERRRADARGRGLDRGRDAPPRPRGVSMSGRGSRAACARLVDVAAARPVRRPRRRASALSGRAPSRRAGRGVDATALLRHPQRRPRARARRPAHRLRLARARRRSIGFVVGADGLSGERAELGGAARHRRRGAREGGWILAQARRAARARARLRGEPRSSGATARSIAVPRRAADDRPRRAATVSAPARRRSTARAGRGDVGAAPPARRPAARRRAGADPRRGAELAAARGAPRVRGALRRTSPPRLGVRVHAAVAVVGADALGQRQRQRLDAAALAADPASAGDDRLRRRPRARAPARDEPQPALLGGRPLGRSGLRSGESGPAPARAAPTI